MSKSKDAQRSQELQRYLQQLKTDTSPSSSSSTVQSASHNSALLTAPLFSWTAKQAAEDTYALDYPQFALLGQRLDDPLAKPAEERIEDSEGVPLPKDDEVEPIFINTHVPWSAFICGKQGSGKSYTLSTMLEGCLTTSPSLGKLPNPLGAIVFNYDSQATNVAEAAYLCSAGIPVDVFVSPSNYETMRQAYRAVPGSNRKNMTIKALYLKPSHLNTERMKRLMAFGDSLKEPPLYMQTVIKTLRQMALDNKGASTFDYDEFRARIFGETFTGQQSGPLELRLDLLESFMEGEMVDAAEYLNLDPHMMYGEYKGNPKAKMIKKIQSSKSKDEILAGKPGRLTVIDLTDPVIDSDSACVLFDICLAIFLEKSQCGKVVALDEAHNYIGKSAASENFTNNILKAVREQRHKGARIIIATQEPTISPKFLDLCSMSIVHAFDSPEWFKALREHLRGAAGLSNNELHRLFTTIGDLSVGESLVFSSAALLGSDPSGLGKLGGSCAKMKTRPRLSKDGGASVVANEQPTGQNPQ